MQESSPRRNTISRGELKKVNVDGCRGCGNVYVSQLNAVTLQVPAGWQSLVNIPQGPSGDLDLAVRVRGRRLGGVLGQRICPECKAVGVK